MTLADSTIFSKQKEEEKSSDSPASCFCIVLAGGFLSVTRPWRDDILTLQFPITLRTEAIKGTKINTNISTFSANAIRYDV
jgi:hypothetical protein